MIADTDHGKVAPGVHARIRSAISKSGLTQEEVAAKCFVTRPYLSTLASGDKKQPSPRLLTLIAAATGVDPSWLISAGECSQFSGRLLGDARRDLRLKGKDVAKSVGISAGYYSELESGKSKPSAGVLAKLAQALHCDQSRFFPRSTPASVPSADEPRPVHLEAAAILLGMSPEHLLRAIRNTPA